MAYLVDLGTTVVDTFPVFEPDGYTKKSGETSFSVTIYKDGVVNPLSSTISEIGSSGEYKISFLPDSVGSWKATVFVSYDRSWWGVDATVSVNHLSEAQINISFDDSVPRMYMEVWLDRGGQPVDQDDLISCEVIATDMAGLVLFTETSSTPKVDDHFSLQYDLGLTDARPYALRVTVVDSLGSVTSIHGFSTVG